MCLVGLATFVPSQPLLHYLHSGRVKWRGHKLLHKAAKESNYRHLCRAVYTFFCLLYEFAATKISCIPFQLDDS